MMEAKMTESRAKCALTGLQWTLGVVVLIESVLLVMPSAGQAFAHTHMPNSVRELLGWSEIAGAVLFLIPRTSRGGGWMLGGDFSGCNFAAPSAWHVQRGRPGGLYSRGLGGRHR